VRDFRPSCCGESSDWTSPIDSVLLEVDVARFAKDHGGLADENQNEDGQNETNMSKHAGGRTVYETNSRFSTRLNSLLRDGDFDAFVSSSPDLTVRRSSQFC